LMLLRKAIGLEAIGDWQQVIGEEEIGQVVEIAQRHGTGPLVFNELLKAIDRLQVTGNRLQAMAMQMKQICMQNMLLQGQWEQVIKKTFQTLEQGGVQAVLMKGFAYARLYPLPYLRSWGDLDIWVGPEQYHQACGLLREAFPEAKHHDEEWDELKHYCFVFLDGKSIELHRVSMDFINKKDQAYWCELEKEAIGDRQQVTGDRRQAIGERLEVNGEMVPMWEPKFDILFCFMHSWEHFCGSGIPLKQVCDLALLVKKLHTGSDPKCSFEETEAYLAKHLKALKMLEVWKYYGYMACKALGIPMTEWPLLVESGKLKVESSLIVDGVESCIVKYGERLYERVVEEGQCRVKEYEDGSRDRYEARDKARKMNILARKMLTLKGRIAKAQFLHQFAPRYAQYIFWQEVKKGIRRTIKKEEMINY